jgi:hypothetical protein
VVPPGGYGTIILMVLRDRPPGLAGEAASHASPPPHPTIACLRVNGMPFSQWNFLDLLRTTITVTATYQRGRKSNRSNGPAGDFFGSATATMAT